MTASTLEGRLLCASKLAYAIAETGAVPAFGPYDAGAGLIAPVAGFANGSSRIDAALVGTSSTDGVVLSFRGTLPPSSPDKRQTLEDWLNDLEIALVVGDQLPGRVHHGFVGALDTLWDDVLSQVVSQLAASSVKRLNITGHSKGGAVAHLAAARFAGSGIVHGSNIVVRTFEGAHPGDQTFADSYQRLVPDAVRYEYADDLVPHVPASLLVRRLFESEEIFGHLMAIDNSVDYAPAGVLRFVDWNGAIQVASTRLRTKRLAHLAEKLATPPGGFADIVRDHSIDCGSGVMRAICPSGVCT